MPWPRFAMITERDFRKLKSADQFRVANEAAEAFPELGRNYGKNPSYRWAFVRKAAELYRETAVARSEAQARPATLRGILPAREVNEWLRTLPPVPCAGEEGRANA